MRTFLVALGLSAVPWLPTTAGAAHQPPRVSVQPFDGDVGPTLRDEVIRALRARGYRIVTSIPRADGTGPYLSLARDYELNAFVTGDVEVHGNRRAITFLVWNGATGSVVGRWSAASESKQLRGTVARGFWKHLARALAHAKPPRSAEPAPAPTMYIDASLAGH